VLASRRGPRGDYEGRPGVLPPLLPRAEQRSRYGVRGNIPTPDRADQPDGESADPRIGRGDRVVARFPSGDEVRAGTANATHAFSDLRGDRVQRTAVSRTIPSAEAEQEAGLMQLEQVGERRRIGAGEQAIEFKEPFAGHVTAEELFL
jgi:hypothetical protein